MGRTGIWVWPKLKQEGQTAGFGTHVSTYRSGLRHFGLFRVFVFCFVRFRNGHMFFGVYQIGPFGLNTSRLGLPHSAEDNFYWTGATPAAWDKVWAEPYGVHDQASPFFHVPWLSVHLGRVTTWVRDWDLDAEWGLGVELFGSRRRDLAVGKFWEFSPQLYYQPLDGPFCPELCLCAPWWDHVWGVVVFLLVLFTFSGRGQPKGKAFCCHSKGWNYGKPPLHWAPNHRFGRGRRF